ncbi:flavodoxin family protein [Raoultibacter phocaeensis]|uniref:flavodoxin family protein n=1 Tax=Raoultibacter phocaeensis TaxID=2479841 RepID=UPI001117DE40|nr:flavodoxin family protein [Raoultibacter phocaeensis]
MKVLLINGSPNEERSTYTALAEAAHALEAEGVETEIAWIGREPVRGCIACGGCSKLGINRCIFDDDVVNRLLEKAERADGYLVGTPVYYAGANGALLAILDRMFFAGSQVMQFKPAAGIASARRAGTTPAIDQINKYFQFNKMPVVSSTYWPMVHGQSAEQVRQDEEGLQTMRMLGKNLAWMLRLIDRDMAEGGSHPAMERKIATNFIRPTA